MRKQVITLSDSAAKRVKEIIAQAKEPIVGVRVGVTSGGCAGMSYVMEYAKKTNPNDEVVEDKGVKVLIDPKAIMYLLGTEMDYKNEEISSTFVFKNPNETERCGCGESFKVWLQSKTIFMVLLYNSELYIILIMRDTKHLGKHANKLAEQAKEKALFRTQRKAVEAGAHGTLDYTIKEGVNKNKIADEKILKSKK